MMFPPYDYGVFGKEGKIVRMPSERNDLVLCEHLAVCLGSAHDFIRVFLDEEHLSAHAFKLLQGELHGRKKDGAGRIKGLCAILGHQTGEKTLQRLSVLRPIGLKRETVPRGGRIQPF